MQAMQAKLVKAAKIWGKAIASLLLVAAVNAVPVTLLWNILMPSLGISKITVWQAAKLCALSGLLTMQKAYYPATSENGKDE